MQEFLDPLDLYRWSTQDPTAQAAVLAEIYRRIRDHREPRILREDFAGNAADATAWVDAARNRRAIAVDFDGPTLEYAQHRAERILGKRSNRIDFIEADVHQMKPPQVAAADVLSVLNFSTFYMHSRKALRRYFEHAHECLNNEGVLILNAYGGPAAMRAHTDQHRIVPTRERGQKQALPPFDYHWQQLDYDACSARIRCRIHFDVPDPEAPEGKRHLANAFSYDWRLWTLPELTETLREAGFRKAQVWRHTADIDARPPTVFLGPVRALRHQELWLAYVVGIR